MKGKEWGKKERKKKKQTNKGKNRKEDVYSCVSQRRKDTCSIVHLKFQFYQTFYDLEL